MASATYPAQSTSSDVLVRLTADGRAEIEVASHDLGTGTYTILSQFAAAGELDLPISKVSCRLADTFLPPGPCAGGSQTVASVGPAVILGCRKLLPDREAGRPGQATASFNGSEPKGFTFQSFGAQFAEVRVDARRWAAYGSTASLASTTPAGSSTRRPRESGPCGIIQGIGMALMEETALDPYSAG